MQLRPEREVSISGGQNASKMFWDLLMGARAAYPEALAKTRPIPFQRFRKDFHRWLPEFELARRASPKAVQIASYLQCSGAALFRLGEIPLNQAVRVPAQPYELVAQGGNGRPNLTRWARHLTLDRLGAECTTPAVAPALAWATGKPGLTSLEGERFAIVGANAELAPTRWLLEAGATVLFIDKTPPRQAWCNLPGRIYWTREGMDLLSAPDRIRATIESFAGTGAHIGLYAYAAGGAQEWRLTAAMNAIVANLRAGCVRSTSLLLSPASPNPIDPEDIEISNRRQQQRPIWQRLWPTKRRGYVSSANHAVSCSVVPAQGLSYQAAQYIGKFLTSEVWRSHPVDNQRISANVAGISRTRSMNHPVFSAAFAGAPKLGVQIYDAEFTSLVATALMLHDLFGVASTARKQVHGGVFSLPMPLDISIGLAAAWGILARPGLLPRILRGR